MARKGQLTQNEKNLIRRYLIWCYKTVKEELDKVDRYFTQLEADEFVLKQLKMTKEYKFSSGNQAYKDSVDQFKVYMKKKETNVLQKKFKDSKRRVLNPEYQYYHYRFIAIEKAIRHFLGAKELDNICLLYEKEMISRILQAREHT